MLDELVKFRDTHGHCNVPVAWEQNPVLGRWVATQRFRGKINALSSERIKRLDDIGFVWSLAEFAWEQKFSELASFRDERGHCDVPAKWDGNPKLASWVNSQRHIRKTGRLSSDRIRRLNEIGFSWDAWLSLKGRKRRCKTASGKSRNTTKRAAASKPDPGPAGMLDAGCEPGFAQDSEPNNQVVPPEDMAGKLYNVASDVFVQHNEGEELPPEVSEFVAVHQGGWPPYIPLPARRTVFLLGDAFMPRRRRVVWRGYGRLDPAILDYVKENGVLPDCQ